MPPVCFGLSKLVDENVRWAMLRMPDLPPGPHRAFVEHLFRFYRLARRPSLEKISAQIQRRDDLRGSVSKETVRKMMNGSTLPVKLEAAEAVLIVLCEMADVNPNVPRGFDDSTPREELEFLWNRAWDAPPPKPAVDPWDDNPPF